MSQYNYYSSKMIKKTDEALKNYVLQKDHFHEEAVLAAIWELEKRGIVVENMEQIKQEYTSIIDDKKHIYEPISSETFVEINTPTLYSTRFIYIFGVLFSVFGGGILMALNFMWLKNKKAAINTILASLGYSFVLTLVIEALGIQNLFISLIASVLGIYLLHYFIWNKEVPSTLNYKERDIWKPIIIGLLIAMPLAYLLLISGNLPQ